MKNLLAVLLVLCLIIPAAADDATQTDWSGDYGVLGPVTNWGDQLDSSEHLSCKGSPGEVFLTSLEHPVGSGHDGIVSIHADDIDGDGDLDIMGAVYYDNRLIWWENTDGSGATWSQHVLESYFVGAWSIYSADLDGDADTDVIGVTPDTDIVA